MSQRFMDTGQIVGYDFTDGKKTLIVTMEEKTAAKMLADGWNVQIDETLGWFITLTKPEGEKGESADHAEARPDQ